MKNNLINIAKRGTAITLTAIMMLSAALAASASENDAANEPAPEVETVESGAADESLEAVIDAEIAAVDEQVSEEAAVIEERVTVPDAEESGEEVTAEEETSGEGFEAGEYSEQIDSGAEVIDESAAEVTEEAEAAESIEVAEEVTEELVAADPVADEEAEAADSEKEEAAAVEEAADKEGFRPYFPAFECRQRHGESGCLQPLFQFTDIRRCRSGHTAVHGHTERKDLHSLLCRA